MDAEDFRRSQRAGIGEKRPHAQDAAPLLDQRAASGGIPDVRDGLTRLERIVLFVLRELQEERGGRTVPTVTIYGRVLDYIDVPISDVQAILGGLSTRVDGSVIRDRPTGGESLTDETRRVLLRRHGG